MDYILRHRTIFLTAVGLVALALVVGAVMSRTMMVEGQGSSPVSATQPTHKAQVNFGNAVGDKYLTTLLGKHDAKVGCAPSGFVVYIQDAGRVLGESKEPELCARWTPSHTF